jgi:hypothetical protein
VTAPEPAQDPAPPEENAPADEEYARAYAAGFEEGIRSALREVIAHSSRGHTAQELRMLAESRLARLSEEVDLKRKSLLAPPRRPAWGALLRPPPPAAARSWSAPVVGRPTAYHLAAGASVLVREERPARALEMLRGNAGAFPRIVIVSLHPTAVPDLAPGQRVEIAPRTDTPSEVGADRLRLSELGGRLREPTEAKGGALVYLDSLEYFLNEEGAETIVRFAHWLVGQVQATGSALVVSFDTRSLDVKDASRLERAFPQIF